MISYLRKIVKLEFELRFFGIYVLIYILQQTSLIPITDLIGHSLVVKLMLAASIAWVISLIPIPEQLVIPDELQGKIIPISTIQADEVDEIIIDSTGIKGIIREEN